MKEMELMRLLKQSHALARRHPRGERGGEGCRSRGAGHILELLTERSGVSQQTIADALGVRAQSASEALAMLEGQGFIRREASPCDRRVTLIHLTDAGRVHAAELVQEHGPVVKSPPANAWDTGSIPSPGRFPMQQSN